MGKTHMVLVGVIATVVALGCGGDREEAVAPTTTVRSCPAPPAADPATAEGWLGWIAAHPGDVALIVDDGRGGRLEHRASDASPSASASKVIHLLAYADAVAAGRLDPEGPVTLAEWEAWYLPGLDGGAHVDALTALGVATTACEPPTRPRSCGGTTWWRR